MRTLNTALTQAFAADGTRCFLLRRAGETQKFVVIEELTIGFWMEYDNYREQSRFEYATTETGFRDKFARATHIAHGVPDAGGMLEIFKLNIDPQRDTIDPNGANPFWKMFVVKLKTERFQIP